jgi:hypothetical protein
MSVCLGYRRRGRGLNKKTPPVKAAQWYSFSYGVPFRLFPDAHAFCWRSLFAVADRRRHRATVNRSDSGRVQLHLRLLPMRRRPSSCGCETVWVEVQTGHWYQVCRARPSVTAPVWSIRLSQWLQRMRCSFAGPPWSGL